MPKHAHNVVYGAVDSDAGVTISYSNSGSRVLNVESWAWRNNGSGSGNNVYAQSTGDGNAHENMPPFKTLFMWQRVA